MQQFVRQGDQNASDELWLLEHQPVITVGIRGRQQIQDLAHLADKIPIIQSDRGGLVTAHNLGQAVLYGLWNVARKKLSVANLVEGYQTSIRDCLADWGIVATYDSANPGVYVNGAKIASIGLRISRGWCYHGISLNVCNDLTLFDAIIPCGMEDLAVCSLKTLGHSIAIEDVFRCLANKIQHKFAFTAAAASDFTSSAEIHGHNRS